MRSLQSGLSDFFLAVAQELWPEKYVSLAQEAMAMGQAVYSQQQQQPGADAGAGPSAGGSSSADNVVDADFKDSDESKP